MTYFFGVLCLYLQVLVGGGDADGKEQRNPLLVKAGEAVFHGMVQKLVMPKIR